MEKLTILLVGSGGREHALAWKIAQSPLSRPPRRRARQPGIAAVADLAPVKADRRADGLVALAQEIAADLVVVGPENRRSEARPGRSPGRGRHPLFRPTQRAAAAGDLQGLHQGLLRPPRPGRPRPMECSSRRRGRDLPRRHGTAPFVIKADGLAAGKGVVIAADPRRGATPTVVDMLGGRFGSAGARVVIEEFMHRRGGLAVRPVRRRDRHPVRRRPGPQARL
jgi:phosphoribosylamine--glycine ligase